MLKIWGRPTSTCTMKVLWTCEEAGLPFQLILASATMGPQGHISRGPPYGVVDTPTYRALNPNGTVPTIDEDGFILWESNTIVRYLARRHAPFLYGNDERTFALASQWMDWETQLVPFLHTLVMEMVRLPPEGRTPAAVLYVEYLSDDSGDEIAERFARLSSIVPGTAIRTHTDPGAMLDAWNLRKAGEPLLHGIPGRRKPVTFVEDNAVPTDRLGEFVRRFREIVASHGTRAAFWAHASVGVLHVRPLLDLRDEDDRARMHSIAIEIADLARSLGGVMSGEHGDGRVRTPLLERFYGSELMSAFQQIKSIFDPAGLLNPGNIVQPRPIESITASTRIRPRKTDVAMPAVETYFEFDNHRGFLGAAELFNGAGVC
ncbi:MAG: glutathione S-transferase N-terminal domain-containing protein, partial [SAR324 cluster bacterium]|nr:glutathione S-transferase N-terminal domain-containing protein [SAR324 cluster bacterium]